MTPEQREIVIGLIRWPNRRTMSNEELLHRFDASDGIELSVSLLQDAIEKRDPLDVALTLGIMFRFGVSSRHFDILNELSGSDWHDSHEDVVGALEELNSEDTVDCLLRLVVWIPSWVEDWQRENIPVKAIWALSKIPSLKAREALERALLQVESPRLIELINDRISKSVAWDDLP